MSDLVSVIIPVYNVQSYITEALDSIVNQSYLNIEIIIINDGSTDNSAVICEVFSKKDNRIKLYNFDNSGLSSARNKGVSLSSGEYIIFFDSDDILERFTIEKCISAFIKNENVNLCFFDAKPFSEVEAGGENLKNIEYSRPEQLMNVTVDGQSFFAKSVINNKYIASACLFIGRASLIKKVKFHEGIYHEDQLFTTTLLLTKEVKAVYLREKFFHRRIRPNSIMTVPKTLSHANGYFIVARQLLNHNLKMNNRVYENAYYKYISDLLFGSIEISYQVNGGEEVRDNCRKLYRSIGNTGIRNYIRINFSRMFILAKKVLQK